MTYPYEPTPEEIAAARLAIQAQWSERVRVARSVHKVAAVEVQEIARTQRDRKLQE